VADECPHRSPRRPGARESGGRRFLRAASDARTNTGSSVTTAYTAGSRAAACR
jgi:hypothetical protein